MQSADKSTPWSRASRLGRLAFCGTMVVGIGLMLSASISYLELGDAHPFFLEKLPLPHPRFWLTTLYVHVPSSLFSLPACLILLSTRVRVRWPRFHRWLGRFTGTLVLFCVVPTGMYLARFAQGGLVTTLGFWLTGAITFVAMIESIRHARRADLRAHRRASAHVVAQLSVAVLSRFALAGADMLGVYDSWVYVAALWLPVVGCVIAAEVLTCPRGSSITKGARNEKMALASRLHALGQRRAR